MTLKLYRDRVISIVNGNDLVGIYVKMRCPCPSRGCDCGSGDYEYLLAEMSPSKADKIIKLWNSN